MAADSCGSILSRARNDNPTVGNSTAMSIPSISMPMIWAAASYPRSTANMTLVLARAETRGPRIRLYCEILPSLLIGEPSKNHSGRRRIPVLPELVGRGDDVTRRLNAGSRYLIEEIDRLHDVHVAVDESVAVFHVVLPLAPMSNSAALGRHPAGPRGDHDLNKAADSVRDTRKWPEQVPAKFEQGGFTSGRREGPQTLFPGTSPGNLHRHHAPTETRRAATHISTWNILRAATTRNFFWLVCKNCNAPRELSSR